MGSGGLVPLLRVRQAAADKDFESGSGTAVSPISAMTARVASAGRAVVHESHGLPSTSRLAISTPCGPHESMHGTNLAAILEEWY